MRLEELIERLGKSSPDQHVKVGFGSPHSYRGYYDDLAFEPSAGTTVGEMLEAAKSALGRTFTGYKGGEFRMDNYTEVWLAYYGETGEGIGPILLNYMLGKYNDR